MKESYLEGSPKRKKDGTIDFAKELELILLEKRRLGLLHEA